MFDREVQTQNIFWYWVNYSIPTCQLQYWPRVAKFKQNIIWHIEYWVENYWYNFVNYAIAHVCLPRNIQTRKYFRHIGWCKITGYTESINANSSAMFWPMKVQTQTYFDILVRLGKTHWSQLCQLPNWHVQLTEEKLKQNIFWTYGIGRGNSLGSRELLSIMPNWPTAMLTEWKFKHQNMFLTLCMRRKLTRRANFVN